MNTCAICQQPMDLIPAGISKTTGKNYQAFYACRDRNHKQPRQARPQTPIQQFNQSLDQNLVDEKQRKITENIRWCNSLNNASLLIAHNPVANQTDQDILTRLYMLAVRIDALESKAPQTHAVAPISRVPQQSEE